MPRAEKTSGKKITADQSASSTGFFSKAKKFIVSGRNPVIALVIVALLSGVGYYGYVRSFADTKSNDTSNPCKDKPNSKACDNYKEAQKEQKQKEAQKLANDCASSNQVVNAAGTGCGGCIDGFAKNDNGNCKKKTDCSAQNKQQNGPFDCGDCKNNYAMKDGKCTEVVNCQKDNLVQVGNFKCGDCIPNYAKDASGKCVHSNTPTTNNDDANKIACEGQNRVWDKTKKTCGGCDTANGYTMNADKCVKKQKVDCKAQNRNQKDDYTCGACLNGYTPYTAAGTTTCLEQGDGTLKAQKACADQLREYNEKTKKCGDCIATYYLNGTACVKGSGLAPSVVKANCKNAHVTYDENANACTSTCVAGYFPKDSKCAELSETNITAAQAACLAQNRQYITGTSCGPCLPNFIVQTGTNVCAAVSADAVLTVKIGCGLAHLQYNDQTNSCKQVCVKNYLMVDGKCQEITDKTDVKAACNKNHYQYDVTTNTCSTKCMVGYLAAPGGTGACVTPDAVKDYCDANHLRFDKTQNVCKDSCQDDYSKVNGICLSKAQAQNQMSEKLCRQLGRTWDSATSACTSTCVDEGATVVPGINDAQSYCKAAGDSPLGVTTGMTEDQCAAAHRIWLVNVKGCSARCTATYHLDETNTCVGLGADGNTVVVCNPATDECKKKCEASGNAADCTTIVKGPVVCDPAKERCSHACEEEKTKEACTIPANPLPGDDGTAQAPQDTAIAVDTTMSADDCALLGREWISIKDAKGNAVEGCSINTCNYTDNSVADNDAAPYCLDASTGSAYVSEISQEDCEALHRVWVESVNGCAQVPMPEGETDKIINAEQCAAPYTTYIVHENGQGECFQPNIVDRAQAVAEIFVASLDAVLASGPATFCELQPGYHWESFSNECKKDRGVAGVDGDDPLAIEATAMSSTQALLNISGIGTDGYTVSYGPENDLKTVGCTSTTAGYGTCFVDGLTPNTSYTFTIKVEGKVVGISNPVRLATACTPFTVEEQDATHVLVTWTHVDGAQYYTVEHNGGWPSDQNLGGNGSQVVERINPGHDTWRVNSFNGVSGFDARCAAKTL